MGIIPTNPFNSLSTQNLLQIIFFSLLLGFSLIKLGDKGAPPVLNFSAHGLKHGKKSPTSCWSSPPIPNIVGDAAAAVVVAKSEGELHPGLVKETAND